MSLLITIEGIDGSGKTTLINNLKKSSELNLLTHNWRDTELGQKVWHLLNEAKGKNGLPSNWSYIFLILTAFDELVKKVIEPNLQKNKVVIVDRYIDSTFVYQGLAGGTEIETIQEVAEKTIDLSMPDITFVLDIDPQKSQERLRKRKQETGEYSNWDKLDLEFHQRIRNYYLELKKYFPERIYFVNAEKSETEILAEVKSLIEPFCLPEKEKNFPSHARVIIKNEKGEFLLVKDKKWGWNFPGGKIEPDESPAAAAKREIFEETNLVVGDLKLIAVKDIFYANLPKGNQCWKGYFYQTSKYSGEIQIKEVGKILDIKFMNCHSPAAKDFKNQQPYQFYLEKIKKLKKYAK